MTFSKQSDTDAYHCCDYHYRLAGFRRADAIQFAERARLASSVRTPSMLHLRGAALLGGGMIRFGTALVRLGGWRRQESSSRLPQSIPLNVRLLQ